MDRMPVVGDLMDHRFPTVTPDTSMKDAIDVLIKKKLLGVLVVSQQGELVGILSEKDCLKLVLHGGFHQLPDDRVGSYMHPAPNPVESRASIVSVAQIFLGNTFRRLPVVDNGKLVGQITRRDIVRGMRRYR
jgi:CBS domain-containing protein